MVIIPTSTGTEKLAIRGEIFSRPVHLLLSVGEANISPTTEKQRAVWAPRPRPMIMRAIMLNTNVGLAAASIDPAVRKNREISSMILRPYMSDSFPKSKVEGAIARAGRDIAHENRAIPFRSAAILGEATL